MKITHRIMSIALAFVMCTGLICTVNANENNGEMYFNFTKESKDGAIDVGTINGKDHFITEIEGGDLFLKQQLCRQER